MRRFDSSKNFSSGVLGENSGAGRLAVAVCSFKARRQTKTPQSQQVALGRLPNAMSDGHGVRHST